MSIFFGGFSISCYVTGSIDPGLLVINGKLTNGVSPEEGENHVWRVINELINEGLSTGELNKVKKQAESTIAFGEVEVLNRAMNLAYCALSGNTAIVNEEVEMVQKVSEKDVLQLANAILTEKNASVLYYKAQDLNEN